MTADTVIGSRPCDCGCCEGIGAATPLPVFNRPGLAAIAYRVGTHGTFKQSLLAALSSRERPATHRLRTRQDDDLSIALLDAAATVADVLTFYQERIANEAYLRTASERRSLVELAALLGYRPRPGLAASAHLAFTLDDADGAPEEVRIETGAKVQSVPGPGQQPQSFETVEAIVARPAWSALPVQATGPQPIRLDMPAIRLAGTATGLRPGESVLIVSGGGWIVKRVGALAPDQASGTTTVRFEAPSGLAMPALPTELQPRFPLVDGIFALRVRAPLFGHNAPDWHALSAEIQGRYPRGESPAGDWPVPAPADPYRTTFDLDAEYAEIQSDSLVVVRTPGRAPVLSRIARLESLGVTGYGLSARVTRLALAANATVRPTTMQALRETEILAQAEPLSLAETPLPDLAAGTTELELDGRYDGLEVGRSVLVSGTVAPPGRPDAAAPPVTASEHGVIAATRINPAGHTMLTLRTGLAHAYQRASVTLNANVAAATHGETRHEVLGSGDASRSFQRFALRQPPLTWLQSDDPPAGARSTLEIRVDGLLWPEVPTLYGRGPHERVYVTQTDDEQRTTVQFGDGLTGARLPTGQENVVATYRQGVGLAGNVGEAKLTLPVDVPLGVRAVANPVEAAGGADPDPASDIRTRAPLSVLTLGRVVSLRDYEDFARDFAGVAKAAATWTWDGQRRGVFLTVAGAGGQPLGTERRAALVEALRRAGDPHLTPRVASFRPAPFRLAARVKPDPDLRADDVLAAAAQAAREAFSFERRRFGQAVALSEVVAVLQGARGVVAVDLDLLYRADGLSGLHPRLEPMLLAAAPQAGTGGIPAGAELLLLAPDGVRLAVMA